MNISKIILITFMFAIFFPFVSAIKIGPGIMIYDFEPNKEIVQSFIVSDTTGDIQFLLEGDLVEFASLDKKTTFFSEGDSQKIEVTLTLPEKIDPGDHVLYIAAGESAGEGVGAIANAKVRAGIKIRVPYPDKYLSARLKPVDERTTLDGKATINIRVTNLGSEAIEKISGTISIKDSVTQEEVAKIPVSEANNLHPIQEYELVGVIEPSNLNLSVGIYTIIGTINYDGQSVTTNDHVFLVGKKSVSVKSVSPLKLAIGTVNKLTANVESVWNEALGYFLDISVKSPGSDEILVSTTTKTQSIGQWGKQEVELFVDASSLELNKKYILEVTPTYDDKSQGETSKFDISTVQSSKAVVYSPSSSNTSDSNTLLYGTIAVVLLVGLIIFFYFKKKRSGQDDSSDDF